MKRFACLVFLAAAGFAPAAVASELIYTPVNPSFGGNPFNSGHLLGVANAVNDNTSDRAAGQSGLSNSELFLRQLESRLLSGLANQVTEAIFGENPQQSGTIKFDDQEIDFSRGVESISLTIRDLATGSVTTISVPTLAPTTGTTTGATGAGQ